MLERAREPRRRADAETRLRRDESGKREIEESGNRANSRAEASVREREREIADEEGARAVRGMSHVRRIGSEMA